MTLQCDWKKTLPTLFPNQDIFSYILHFHCINKLLKLGDPLHFPVLEEEVMEHHGGSGAMAVVFFLIVTVCLHKSYQGELGYDTYQGQTQIRD